MSPWGLSCTRTLPWAEVLGSGWRKHFECDQLGFWFSVLQEAPCGRSSLVPSAGDSRGRAGEGLVPRHREEGECQGEDRFWEGLVETLRMGFRSGQELTSWGWEQELQRSKNSAKPSRGLFRDPGS